MDWTNFLRESHAGRAPAGSLRGRDPPGTGRDAGAECGDPRRGCGSGTRGWPRSTRAPRARNPGEDGIQANSTGSRARPGHGAAGSPGPPHTPGPRPHRSRALASRARTPSRDGRGLAMYPRTRPSPVGAPAAGAWTRSSRSLSARRSRLPFVQDAPAGSGRRRGRRPGMLPGPGAHAWFRSRRVRGPGPRPGSASGASGDPASAVRPTSSRDPRGRGRDVDAGRTTPAPPRPGRARGHVRRAPPAACRARWTYGSSGAAGRQELGADGAPVPGRRADPRTDRAGASAPVLWSGGSGGTLRQDREVELVLEALEQAVNGCAEGATAVERAPGSGGALSGGRSRIRAGRRSTDVEAFG